ncbi:hypothetical protein ACFOWA_11620 [Pedobacter lithocola]|uniref:Lipoprotein n=1 Tax=Pedobacter lithocola TaxID=1908239 RepID=A0ABV8PBY6_9SPHI
MKYISLIVVILLFGCNPFPKKDAHPEVPLLADLLKDETKFKKVFDGKDFGEVVFLNDDRILIKPNNSNLPFKIFDVDNKVIFKAVYNWNMPFYIDEKGNLYFNQQKFFYPDYKKQENFKTVVVADSLSKKAEQVKGLNDSLGLQAIKKYEIELLKPYNLVPCENSIVITVGCSVFKIKNNTLIVMQTDLFKSEQNKPQFEIPKFDDDVLTGWNNGRLPSPAYLAYYELNKQKFKCDDMTNPKTITLKSNTYFYASSLGLYKVLF